VSEARLLPLAAILMTAALVFPPVAGYQAVYLTIGAGVILLGFAVSRDGHWLPPVHYRLLALSLALLLGVAVAAGARPGDWTAALIILLLLPGAGVIGAARVAPGLVSAQAIGLFCLIGAAIGVAFGLFEVLGGEARAGVGNNPLHYSALVVMIGLASLVGFVGNPGPARYIYLLGPGLALAATILSGSRGTLLATVVAAPILVGMVVWWHRTDKVLVGLTVAAVLALIPALVFVGQDSRAVEIFGLFRAGLTEGLAVIDEQRVDLYSSALRAFADAPFLGHGYAGFMNAAERYMTESTVARDFDHLHNDPLDFAVIGGAVGLVAYACVLAAPLAALRLVGNPAARPSMFLGMALALGYLLLGMTNAMFGVLPQTVLFGVLLGCVVALEPDGTKPAG